MKNSGLIFLIAVCAALLVASSLWAQNVKITPIGAVAGEFCAGDRALLFEDPTGVRVLIAPGRTVGLVSGGSAVGSNDPRIAPLGSVHVLLIDHPHVDHLGDVRQTNCAGTTSVPFAPPGDTESNAAEIAARHKSAVLVGGELPDFFTQKIKNITGTAPGSCPTLTDPNTGFPFLDNRFTVPRASPCIGVIRGGTRTVYFTNATSGVAITTIEAFHAAGAPRINIDPLDSVSGPGVPPGLTGYAGHETGYIMRFTNGLTVLWTGDSGLIGDWEVQSRLYRPNLAVVHAGDLFTMGPFEGAFAVGQLIKPRSVIPEHFNQASTSKGVVNPGTRVEQFISLIKGQGGTRVVVPLSDATFEFDGAGNCVAGC
jgi:L-ascorbate metabolism protein UlaG (beta-lactamase superfamily)